MRYNLNIFIYQILADNDNRKNRGDHAQHMMPTKKPKQLKLTVKITKFYFLTKIKLQKNIFYYNIVDRNISICMQNHCEKDWYMYQINSQRLSQTYMLLVNSLLKNPLFNSVPHNPDFERPPRKEAFENISE